MTCTARLAARLAAETVLDDFRRGRMEEAARLETILHQSYPSSPRQSPLHPSSNLARFSPSSAVHHPYTLYQDQSPTHASVSPTEPSSLKLKLEQLRQASLTRYKDQDFTN